MTLPESPEPAPPGVDRCLACGESLAHDQRYCVHCGTRRGSLPPAIAASLREMSGSESEPAGSAAPADAGVPEPAERRSADIFPLARAAAVSILLMLGLGAVFGASLRPGGVASLARDVVVIVHHPAPAPTSVASTPSPSPSTGGGDSTDRGSSSGGAGTAASSSGVAGRGSGSGSSSGSGSGSGSGTGGGSGSGSGSGGPEPADKLPPIGHVWEIVLSGQGYSQSFGTTKGHAYLSKTLANEGELITQYDAVATSPLANEVALISGQGPTEQTIANCPAYADITPATTGKLGQVLGSGCLYPSSTETLGQQMQIDGLTWRAYIQGIGSAGQRHPGTTATGTTPTGTTTTPTAPTTTAPPTTATVPATAATITTGATTSTTSTSTTPSLTDTSTAAGCPHPAEGAADGAQAVNGADDYVTWKNPWVYFHSAVDDHAACVKQDVGLTRLAKDLRKDSTTPAFSYIAPDPCDDGSDTPCRAGAKGGLAPADAFLHTVVPEIERSEAYKTDGLILITFDEAPQSGPDWSTASCCGQPTFPNLAPSTTTSATPTVPTTTTPTTPTAPTSPVPTTTGTVPGTPTGTTTAATTTTGCPATTGTTSTTPTTPTTPTTTTSTTTTTSDCAPAITGDPPGGGQVGLLMISPYIKPHTLNTIETYNHFSLLKSIETLFGLPHLGYTADRQVPAFIPSLFLSQKR
jgi:hypothetical protein